MSEMVEQVAAAIKDAAVIVLDYSDVTYLEDPMVVARAAIEAMRKPTRAMINAGLGEYDMVVDSWDAMIDAALKD